MLVTVGFAEVRHMAVYQIGEWLNNPTLARNAKELLRRISTNCLENTQSEVETARVILELKVKPTYQSFHVECVTKLMQANSAFALLGTLPKELLFFISSEANFCLNIRVEAFD